MIKYCNYIITKLSIISDYKNTIKNNENLKKTTKKKKQLKQF